VTVGTNYEALAKELVWRLKFSGAQAAASEIAGHLATIYVGDANVLVVPVPTSSQRVRQRGYDQANLLAKELSQRLGRRYLPCLTRVGQKHQVGASRSQRLAQLSGAFRVNATIVDGAHILLVDDVLTTGATLQAAARVLKAAGAKRVEAIVFAQA
jgi:ComF family protein